ncbi:MAG TPA: hypothetical protein VHE61_15890, partial [Opitutaceae bacterium]|nr:hypothetical protein [Opitutaceae bacterium]
KLSSLLGNLERFEAAAAGLTADVKKAEVAELIFNGTATPPKVRTTDLTIVYVGALKGPSAADLQRYPGLKNEPLIEVAALHPAANGWRFTPLLEAAPKFLGFGPLRVDAQVVSITLPTAAASGQASGSPRFNVSNVSAVSSFSSVTVLRAPGPLVPGRYAALCGPQAYEFEVE